MKLIDHPLRVVLLAYSFWAQFLGVLALVLPEVVFKVTGIDMNPAFLWWLALGLLLFGLAGRLVQQTGSALRNALQIVAVAALILLVSFVAAHARTAAPPPALTAAQQEAEALALAIPRVLKWEGKRNHAYIPIPGDVPTICSGTTRGVRPGDYKTDAQCAFLLREEVTEYRRGVLRYFTADTLRYRLPPLRDAVWTSFAINVGISAAGKSTATRRLNAGDVVGGCRALGWWNKAGGRVVRGLVNRRAEDVRDCLVGAA